MEQDIWEDGLNFIEDNWDTDYGKMNTNIKILAQK